MMWSNHGWWWLGVLLMPVLMTLCFVMMFRMMNHGAHNGFQTGQAVGHGGPPEGVLAERLARGEIDIEEYERRLAVLQRTSELHRT